MENSQMKQSSAMKRSRIKNSTLQQWLKQEQEDSSFEDGKLTKAIFSQFILIEKSCGTLALIGVSVGIVIYDLEFEES